METENKKSSIIDGFARNSIIFYLILVVLGYITTVSYYKIFGIDVYDYFAIDDYINVVFDNLFLIIIATLCLIFLVLLFFELAVIKKWEGFPFNYLNRGPDYQEKPKQYNKRFRKQFLTFFIISIVFEIICLVWFFITHQLSILAQFVVVIGAIFATGLMVVLTDFDKFGIYKNNPLKRSSIGLAIILGSINFGIVFDNGTNLYESKTNKQKMIFYFDSGKSIKTSDSTLYLGSSKDYIFLYSKPSNKALIYNKSTVGLIENEKGVKRH
jgi:hypothetical protein